MLVSLKWLVVQLISATPHAVKVLGERHAHIVQRLFFGLHADHAENEKAAHAHLGNEGRAAGAGRFDVEGRAGSGDERESAAAQSKVPRRKRLRKIKRSSATDWENQVWKKVTTVNKQIQELETKDEGEGKDGGEETKVVHTMQEKPGNTGCTTTTKPRTIVGRIDSTNAASAEPVYTGAFSDSSGDGEEEEEDEATVSMNTDIANPLLRPVPGARLSRRQSSQLEDSSSFEDEEDDDDIRSVLSAPSLPVLARRLQDESRACSSDIDDSSDDDEYGKSPSQQLKQQGARPEVHIV